jgi:hypothetical protein
VIPHLPHNTPPEDIFGWLVSLGFDVVSVKQMTATHWSPPESPKSETCLYSSLPSRRRQSPRKFSVCQSSTTFLSGWRLIEPRMLLYSAKTARSSATFGLIANNLPAVCRAGADTCTRTAQRRETLLPHQHAVTVSWRRKRILIPPTTAAADMRRSSYRSGSHREHQVPQASLPVAKKKVSRILNNWKKQVSHFRLQMQRVCSGQNIECSSNGSTAYYDSV